MNMHPHPGAGNSSIPSSYPNQMPRGQQHQQPPMASMNIGHDHSGPPPNSFIPPTIAYPVPSRAQYPPQPPPGMINSNPNMMPNQNQSILGNLNAPQQQQQQQQGSEGNKMRVFTGTVKKMHGNFGFVDDDVYFQLNTVKGPPPKLGDRVLVEAAYNANMPFKWNASRVQVLPHVSSNDVSGPMQQQLQRQLQPNQGVKVRDGDRDRNRGRRDRDRARAKPDADNDPSRANGNSTPSGRLRGQSCDRHPRPTSAPRNAGKGDESARRRSRSPRRPTSAGDSTESTNMRHRSRSPRRNHHGHHSSLDEPISPPYRVAIPKISTAAEEAGVMTLKSRYPNLYIPSDFFSAQFSWSTAFDTQSQFPLMRKKAPLKVHVFPKDVETLDADGEGPRGAVNADDCSHEYSAKVMLPSWPSFREVCDQTLGSLGSSKPSPAPTAEPRHPTRCLEFLVGTKNRNEIGAIGGPWSPSLDGKNPAENPHVLINTAVRTVSDSLVKFCDLWCIINLCVLSSFLSIIFLQFKSLTGIDLDGCNTWYKFVELHYFRSAEDYKGKITPAHVETVVIFIPDIWRLQLDVAKWKKSAAAYEVIGQRKLQELADAAPASAAESEAEAAVAEVATADVTGNQMMHWSELDPKNMKIDDLRMQLKLRKLSDAGLKSNLIARMHKAIKADQEADDLAGEMEDREASTAAPSESKPKGKSNRVTRYEREKVNLEKLFFLQEDTPKLVVHPCKTAKGGKFDCAVMSLSVLLDYRQEDQKESSFEVSLFAELFNEMLLRDFGLKIYRTMSTMAKINPVADKTKASGEDVKGKAEGTPSAAVIEAAPVIYTPAIPPFDPFLLVAFVYFDLNRTGYILEKDLGELLETLGLSLSRNQIKSVVSGFAGQDGQKVYYENLCEKYDGSIIMEGQEFMEEDEEEEEDDSLGNMQLVRCLKEKSVEGSGELSERL